MTWETGGLELAATIILVLQANRLTKCASHPSVWLILLFPSSSYVHPLLFLSMFLFLIFWKYQKNIGGSHYVKIVQMRSFLWSVFSRIRTEYGKIRTRKNSVFGHFSRSVLMVLTKRSIDLKWINRRKSFDIAL